jgi:tetratricopeptide (TPR) repeat protein
MKGDGIRGTCLRARACFLTACASLLSAAVGFGAEAATNAAPVSMAEVEKALSAEDWAALAGSKPNTESGRAPGLLDAVSDDPEASPDPVLRWIKGHVCLALNRNNESVSLFLSVATPEELAKCQRWADRFLKAHPEAAVAGYLKADTLAREELWADAIRMYDTAESRCPPANSAAASRKVSSRALICNARGVVHLRLDHYPEALNDLNLASEYAGFRFADACANQGAYEIQKRSDPEMGIGLFTQALKLSPNFALAYYGRACLRLIRRTTRTETEADVKRAAAEDFQNAFKYAGRARPLLLAELTSGTGEGAAPLTASETPGSVWVAKFDRVSREVANNRVPFANTGKLNALAQEYRTLPPAAQRQIAGVLNQRAGTNSDVAKSWNAIQDRNLRAAQNPARVGGNAQINIGIARIGGTIESGGRNPDDQRAARQAILSGQGPKPGGVEIQFVGSVRDLGNWPFAPAFGVMY